MKDVGGSLGAKPGQRFVALDSLRGICALVVALYHFQTTGWIYNAAFVQHGFLFVDFFFVLSGFVIARSYGERLRTGFPIGTFALLRFGRIYPLHVVILALFALSELLFAYAAPGFSDRAPFTGSYGIGPLIYTVLLVQVFFGPTTLKWNAPSWSIAVEMWTYLLFALAMRWAGRLIVPICLAIACLAPAYLAMTTTSWIAATHDGALARCLFGFSAGVLANAALTRLNLAEGMRHLSGSTATAIEIAAAIGAIVFVARTGTEPRSLLAPPLFMAVVLLFAFERGAVSAVLRTRLPVWLGGLSYSIYLVHELVQHRFANLLGLAGRVVGTPLVISVGGSRIVGVSPLFGDLMSLTMLSTVVAVAWLTYRYVELPGQLWSRRIALGRGGRGGGGDAAEAKAPTF